MLTLALFLFWCTTALQQSVNRKLLKDSFQDGLGYSVQMKLKRRALIVSGSICVM